MKRALLLSLLAAIVGAVLPGTALAAFGLESVESSLEGASGEPQLAAGAHPNFSVGFKLNTAGENKSGALTPEGNIRDAQVTLPTGLIGNPDATPKCSQSDLVVLTYEADCDPRSQVGIATIYLEGGPTPVPLYNMVPPEGVAGQFAFNFVNVLVFVNATVTAEGGYRLRTNVSNISQVIPLTGTSIEFWGVPGSPAHDGERAAMTGYPVGPNGPEGDRAEKPLFSNPTNCTGAPLRTEFRVNSWRAPEQFSYAASEVGSSGAPQTITDCEGVPFEASLSAQPTTGQADSPSGLEVDVKVPQNDFAAGRAASDLREATISLPEGMTLNPAVAGGLAACSPAQLGLGSDTRPSCPESSKIGSLSLQTPLLEAPLVGSVYVAQQHQNPFGSLLALYLVVDDPGRGVLIKIPGKVEPDPATGRLVVRFSEAPQLPFSDLHVSIFGGGRAPLTTPPTCGTYTTSGDFVPWSGGASSRGTDTFAISSGPEGGPCPSGRFTPGFEGSMADAAAGHYSPLELRFTRDDGTERLRSVTVGLPRGLLANLSGIPYCSDAALAAIPSAEGTGAAQLAVPSCPAASRVGSVSVAAGAGTSPFWAKTGTAYLAGPYRGAPLSLAVVTPALAGPFDLGNVVVRTALEVDPTTAQVSAQSDPLPTILAGVPLDLRALVVNFDRQDFTLDPTSCAPASIDATLVSIGGKTATQSRPFAAKSCSGLGFSPKLALGLKGGTGRTAYPALTATVTARPGQANISRVSVALPRSEFLAQNHIKTVCTRVQFAARSCPADSIYGYAEAITPLLSQPLKGPVYLRSSSNKLPDLVVSLEGQIGIVLDGRIESKNGGIRTVFAGVPDAPLSKFVLRLRGGKKSLIVNSQDLCRKPLPARVRMIGQNGAIADSAPALGVGCGKK